MNTLQLIIKYKLWSILKDNDLVNIEKNFIDYIFLQGKIEIIDEIKNDQLLEVLLEKYIKNDQPYKFEKKMLMYLKENIKNHQFTTIIKRHSENYILLNWIKRNQSKSPFFDFLKELNTSTIEQGLFLYYCSHTENKKLISYAIDKTKTYVVTINEKYVINLLLEKNIKEDEKIKLLIKYKDDFIPDIMNIFFQNIIINDQKVVNWLIDNYPNELKANNANNMNIIQMPYNDLMEKILDKHAILFINNNNMFYDNFFEKIVQYKKENNNNIKEVCSMMLHWGIQLNETSSNRIFNKYVNYDNMSIMLDSKLFKYKKNNIISEYTFEKIMQSNNNESDSVIKEICEKLLKHNIIIDEIESYNILKKYMTIKKMDYLLECGLFQYKLEKLLDFTWKKNTHLGIKIAQKMEKNALGNYIDKLPDHDKKIFQLEYLNTKFEERKKEKKLKI